MGSNGNAIKPLLGCFGLILFVIGVILAVSGVGSVFGIPLIIICVVGSRLASKA